MPGLSTGSVVLRLLRMSPVPAPRAGGSAQSLPILGISALPLMSMVTAASPFSLPGAVDIVLPRPERDMSSSKNLETPPDTGGHASCFSSLGGSSLSRCVPRLMTEKAAGVVRSSHACPCRQPAHIRATRAIRSWPDSTAASVSPDMTICPPVGASATALATLATLPPYTTRRVTGLTSTSSARPVWMPTRTRRPRKMGSIRHSGP
mmetsp:Transcript_8062/g.20721  ORF Transcript_8062/g.20721 Transcript_8062/m.20721 type:complete len:206 (-) Transcript_8062:624-1241(-)